MISLVAATRNRGKLREYEGILGDPNRLLLLSLCDVGITAEVAETGATFLDNARMKARAYHCLLPGKNVMAEDAGLEVPALGNKPGVQSARYAGPGASDAERITKLLRQMKGIVDRRARFVAVVCCILVDGTESSFQGEAEGLILDAPRGDGGFGYDPVFFYPPLQKSFAELSPDEKNRISHRARALNALKLFLLGSAQTELQS